MCALVSTLSMLCKKEKEDEEKKNYKQKTLLGGGLSLNMGQLIDWEDNYRDSKLQT